MRANLILLVASLLLFPAGISVHAQAGAIYPLYVRPPASQACPVGVSAIREVGGPLHQVKGVLVPQSQGLDIRFTAPADRILIKAEIVVHGAATLGREGMILTGPVPARDRSSESFQLSAPAGSPLLKSTIWTRNMTAISWIEVTRLEYSTGDPWQPTAESRCTAAPSLYVPVVASAP